MSAPAAIPVFLPTAADLQQVGQRLISTNMGNAILSRITGVAPNTMWARDVAYAPQAHPVDGTRCAVDGSADLTQCGQGGTMCNWRFIQVDRPCDASAYLQVMFQADRYLWCQTQLSALLGAMPGGLSNITADNDQPRYASAWVDWCRKVMQLVSMARWSTNIDPGYLPDVNDMPAAQALIQAALADHASTDLRGVAAPSKVNADDAYPLKDQLLLNLFKPSVKLVPYNANFAIPRVATDFDPVMLCNANLLVPQAGPHVIDDTGRNMAPDPQTGGPRELAFPVSSIGSSCPPIERVTAEAFPGTTTCPRIQVWGDQRVDGMPPGTVGAMAPWPASWVPVTSADSRVERRMYLWFNATLGTSFFAKSRGTFYARPRVKTNGQVSSSMVTTSTNFWWGSASLQIRLCQAWAQDVVNTPFERMVASGFQSYLDTVSIIPEQYRNLATANITALRNALSEKAFQDASEVVAPIFGAAAGIAAAIPGAGAVIGAIIAAVGALIEGLAKILSGLIGRGSFGWEPACIPPPVMRMIKSTTDQACDFDPSDGGTGAVVARATAVQAAADAGLPVSVWHDVAQTASPGAPSFGPLTPGPPLQPATSATGWWVLGLFGAGVAGLLIYKATR